MTLKEIISEIKLELTGNLLELEIPDTTLEQVIMQSLRVIQRYIDSTALITVPFASCIDLTESNIDVDAVVNVYRTEGYMSNSGGNTSVGDPLYMQMWTSFTNGGCLYNLNNWISNFASWNTALQIRNTISTDLDFKQDKLGNKLYINCLDKPPLITIEYIPNLRCVEDIKSAYWIDILVRYSVAMTKIVLGRIRTRYKQSNALWTQDGDTLLEEGTAEKNQLLEILRVNSQLTYPLD